MRRPSERVSALVEHTEHFPDSGGDIPLGLSVTLADGLSVPKDSTTKPVSEGGYLGLEALGGLVHV